MSNTTTQLPLHHITTIRNKAGEVVSYRVRVGKKETKTGERCDQTISVANYRHQPAALMAAIELRYSVLSAS